MKGIHLSDGDQPLRVLGWKRMQDGGVQHAPDRRVAADPERQDEHGQYCGAWIFQKLAEGVAKVVHI